MRRLTLVVSLIIACVGLVASPALAQRDPFDPVIDVNAGVAPTSVGTTIANGNGSVQPAVGSEGLATTGANVSSWLSIAYMLFVAGGAALVLSHQVLGRPGAPRTVDR